MFWLQSFTSRRSKDDFWILQHRLFNPQPVPKKHAINLNQKLAISFSIFSSYYLHNLIEIAKIEKEIANFWFRLMVCFLGTGWGLGNRCWRIQKSSLDLLEVKGRCQNTILLYTLKTIIIEITKIKLKWLIRFRSWGVEVSPDTNPTSTQMSPLGFGVREYLYLVSILIVLSIISYRFSYLIMA